MSIGLRTNPYGADVVANPTQIRRTLARNDPRQCGLFAAVWAVGVLAATARTDVQSLCLGAVFGPFGIAHSPQPNPQPFYDDTPDARLFPLFHVIRCAADMLGHKRLIQKHLPDGLACFRAAGPDGHQTIVANISDRLVRFSTQAQARVAILDSQTFSAAAKHATWVEEAMQNSRGPMQLEPCAIAFAHRARPYPHRIQKTAWRVSARRTAKGL